MMEEYTEWSFESLLTEYMALGIYFDRECKFKQLPRSLQIEVKRFTAALNAFTGGHFNARNSKGKKAIMEAFAEGFGKGNELCTNQQLADLRKLFMVIEDLFAEFEDEKPKVSDFYRYLFATYHDSYRYVTVFDNLRIDLYTEEFLFFDAFKLTKINNHIQKKVKTIFTAIKILLGEMCDKKFSTSELIANYGYPDVSNEQLAAYNQKWCRYYGFKYREAISSKNYIDRYNYDIKF